MQEASLVFFMEGTSSCPVLQSPATSVYMGRSSLHLRQWSDVFFHSSTQNLHPAMVPQQEENIGWVIVAKKKKTCMCILNIDIDLRLELQKNELAI